MTYRTLRGVEVSEDNLGFDAIVASVLGDGHFLGSDHTLAAMERDYHYPEMADREQPRTWAEAGSLTAWDRANVKAKDENGRTPFAWAKLMGNLEGSKGYWALNRAQYK